MSTFPDWHDPLDVPTVGDDVRIRHVVTLDANVAKPTNFRLSVQPRSGTATLSEHAQAIGALLQTTHNATARFLDRYLRPSIARAEMGTGTFCAEDRTT